MTQPLRCLRRVMESAIPQSLGQPGVITAEQTWQVSTLLIRIVLLGHIAAPVGDENSRIEQLFRVRPPLSERNKRTRSPSAFHAIYTHTHKKKFRFSCRTVKSPRCSGHQALQQRFHKDPPLSHPCSCTKCHEAALYLHNLDTL